MVGHYKLWTIAVSSEVFSFWTQEKVMVANFGI